MTSVPHPFSSEVRAHPNLIVVKIYGKHRRAERASKILRRLGVDHRSTVCVCQDDLMREALQALGITSLSFYDVIDRDAELAAWREAIAVRNEMLALLSRAQFSVRGYQCTEGLVGIGADEFAFLATLVSLRDDLISAGFRRVVFLPSENSFDRIPDNPPGSFHVTADHAAIETPRTLLKKFTHILSVSPLPLYVYLLPFLAMFIRRTAFQEFIAYNAGKSSRYVDERERAPIRVLVVASDSPDFPSYYSRPAASIAAASVKEGDQTLIVTNPIASPMGFSRQGFKGVRCKKLVLAEAWKTWKKALLLHGHVVRCPRRAPKGVRFALWGLACQLLKEKLMARAYSMAGAVTLFDDLFTRFLPNVVVVVPDSSYFGMAAVAVARRNKVPSLTTLAGQIFDHPQYGFLNADFVAVNGDSAKELYLRRGIPSSRVFVTGMAHYDDTFRLGKSLLRSRERAESKVIVFATENLPLADTFAMISPVASAALAIPQARVVIRPHPRENPSNYRDFVKRFSSDRIMVDSTTPLLELLSKADVCVTGFSNVAVEAMILECPVVCMNLTGRPNKLPYAQEGAALGVHHPDEVGPAITKALFDEETKISLAERQTAYLKKQFHTTTGDASLRIARLIEELAGKSMNRK